MDNLQNVRYNAASGYNINNASPLRGASRSRSPPTRDARDREYMNHANTEKMMVRRSMGMHLQG